MKRGANESCRSFIERLSSENKKFYDTELGDGALKDLQQKFPHPWLYVAELIQNAADEKATIVRFQKLNDKTLIFEHNGEPFDDEKDVTGLCTKGVSSKGAGTVGFMGVGFKSVFKAYEVVKISSADWKFLLRVKTNVGEEFKDVQRNWLGAVLPEWDESLQKPSEGMTCRFELTDRLAGNHTIESDLRSVFKEDKSLLPLLANQGITELDWDGTIWLLSIDQSVPFSDQSGFRHHIVATDSKNAELHRWIVFSQNYSPSSSAIKKFLEHRQLKPKTIEEKNKIYADAQQTRKVDAFFEVDKDLYPMFPQIGEAYALLPTSVKLPIGVNIQADWLLTQSRQEFMDIDLIDNPWHQEIIEAIPLITRHYFEWLVSDEGPQVWKWRNCFNILPLVDDTAAQTYAWFLGVQASDAEPNEFIYCRSLIKQLQDFKFLPWYTSDGIEFSAPEDARILPEVLSNSCGNNNEFKLWDLFGDNIVSRELVEPDAIFTLISLGLLKELGAQELASRWTSERVKEWYTSFIEADRDKMLEQLLSGLAEMDDFEDWQEADLICLPTEGNCFISRNRALRFPSEWTLIVNEQDFAEEFMRFLAEKNRILNWSIDRKITTRPWNKKTSAEDYIETIERPDLKSIITKWWDKNSSAESKETYDFIVRFTAWVALKAQSRKEFVQRVLCLDDKKTTIVARMENALLEHPYAGNYRKVFFPSYNSISDYYKIYNDSINWKSFFESFNPSPKGEFSLPVEVTNKSEHQLGRLIGPDNVPGRRAGYKVISWEKIPSIKITNREFTIVDFPISNEIIDGIQSGDRGFLSSFSKWLNENISSLKFYTQVYILYIPAGCGYWDNIRNKLVPQWVQRLNESRWISSSRSEGLLLPSEVLKKYDPARPDAPVAMGLSDEVIEILVTAGIQFELNVPKAGPLQKLQALSNDINSEELFNIITEIIDSNDVNTLNQLKIELGRTALIKVPQTISLFDGAKRVPFSRIVNRIGPGFRSNLRWVLSALDLQSDPYFGLIRRKLIRLYDIPARTTAFHAIEFLQAVWIQQPDAELVNKYLPYAYSYILEGVNEPDGMIKNKWKNVSLGAKVYTLGRQWTQISESNPIYHDDLHVPGFRIVPKNQIVTPSHLASTDNAAQQKAIAKLLNIPLLSADYKIIADQGSAIHTPDSWTDNFLEIQKSVVEYLNLPENYEVSDNDSSEEEVSFHQYLGLARLEKISQKIVKLSDDSIIDSKLVNAIKSGNIVYVSGMPAEFASDLCNMLITHFNATSKKNVSVLASALTTIIFFIDNNSFNTHLNKFRNNIDLDPIRDISPSTAEVQLNIHYSSDENNDENRLSVNNSFSNGIPSSGKDLVENDGIVIQAHVGVKIALQDNGNEQLPDIVNSMELAPKEPNSVLNIPEELCKNESILNYAQNSTPQPAYESTVSKEKCANEIHVNHGNTGHNPPSYPTHGKTEIGIESNKQNSKNKNRLISYVVSDKSADSDGYEESEENSVAAIEIGKAAESLVMEYEKRRGWVPTNMNDAQQNNHGFDILSTSPEGNILYIEVKGLNGAWTNIGVGMSATQFKFAMTYQEAYSLYVVENALLPDKSKIYRIENPAEQIVKYQFDHGWKNVANPEYEKGDQPGNSTEVIIGQRVKIESMGVEGEVKDIITRGKMSLFRILLDDGNEIQKLFNPIDIKKL